MVELSCGTPDRQFDCLLARHPNGNSSAYDLGKLFEKTCRHFGGMAINHFTTIVPFNCGPCHGHDVSGIQQLLIFIV